MVSAWFMDISDPHKDQREEHKFNPNREVSLDELKTKTGVEYFHIPLMGEGHAMLDRIRKERGYSYQDEINIEEGKLPNYEAKLKMFFEEHLHSDEEIRYCVAGSGYFDVRDENDEWIRIELAPEDMIILPAGIYHRFTLDTKNYIKAQRFFVGEPVWTPHNRPAENHPARVSYTNAMKSGFGQIQAQNVKG